MGTSLEGRNSSQILMSILTSPRSIGCSTCGVVVEVVAVLVVVLDVELVLEVVVVVLTVVLGTNSPHTPNEQLWREKMIEQRIAM